jgi:hypothetical protein
MEPDERRIPISWWSAAGAAIPMAYLLGYIAHDDLGLTRQEILTPALIAATIIGLLLAIDHFGKKLRKPK